MNKWTWLCLPVLFSLDRASKIWADRVLRFEPGGTKTLIPGVLRLRFAENDGAAFSLFAGNRYLLIGMTSFIMLILLLYLIFGKHKSAFAPIPLMLVLAGGLGNLYDRALYGKVIDYFDFEFVRFAIFNLADVFVCVGAGLFVVALLFAERKVVKSE